MTKKVISPEKIIAGKKQPVTIGMKYNKGNQLTEMTVGKDKLTYSYDPNGSMIQKVLNSQKYGTLTDAYTYDALDQLTGYTGYDGYEQAFVYDAAGMRLSKKEKGSVNRSTLEELLRGSIAGLPEIYEPSEIRDGYEWATTEYLYDITQEYYQVIREKTTTQNCTETTEYVYGLERIAGYSDNNRTNYIYDGRGSVAQTITVPVPGKAAMDVLQETQTAVAIQSYAYTPFGEQLKTKASGFAYNAEAYDVATGMINLRARQYEPTMNRFGQKDILKGQVTTPLSLNRYGYCENNPILFADSSGMQMVAALMVDGGAGKVKREKQPTKEIGGGGGKSKREIQPIEEIEDINLDEVDPLATSVNIKQYLTNSKDVKMPLEYLKDFQIELMKAGTTYSGAQVIGFKNGKPISECVGFAGRFAGSRWFESDYAKHLPSYVSSVLDHSRVSGKVTKDMKKFDGMMLTNDTHIATFYFEFPDLEGNMRKDVVVDLPGSKYPPNASAKEKAIIDKKNEDNIIRITDWNEAYSKYKTACDCYYVDYGDIDLKEYLNETKKKK